MKKYSDSIDKITQARLRLSAFGSIFSIALTMLLIGCIVFLAFFSMQYIHNISKKIEVEVLFYADVKEVDIVSMEQSLKLQTYITSSRVSSQADNTKEAIKTLGNNYMDIIANPINASIIFSVNAQYANTDSMKLISKRLKENPNVQDVQYPNFLMDSILSNWTYQLSVLGICLLFMFISMLLIANSIRLSIYAKRFNIKSMLLVGASRAFVRRPFVFKGFMQGLWGGLIATLLLSLLLYEGNLFFPYFIDFSYILWISILLGCIFLFSMFFTTFVSLFAVNKYIKLKSDRFYF
jgi:cell division transport system permease protein